MGFSRIRDHIICLTVKGYFADYRVSLPHLMGVPLADNAVHRVHNDFLQRKAFQSGSGSPADNYFISCFPPSVTTFLDQLD
jgi:hypothetical protein